MRCSTPGADRAAHRAAARNARLDDDRSVPPHEPAARMPGERLLLARRLLGGNRRAVARGGDRIAGAGAASPRKRSSVSPAHAVREPADLEPAPAPRQRSPTRSGAAGSVGKQLLQRTREVHHLRHAVGHERARIGHVGAARRQPAAVRDRRSCRRYRAPASLPAASAHLSESYHASSRIVSPAPGVRATTSSPATATRSRRSRPATMVWISDCAM